MDTQRIDQALARLDAALTRVEAAARNLPKPPAVPPEEFDELRQRHDRLKSTVASSLKQLDEILAGANP
ncbi:MAG: hypothetical protein LC648_06935 [Novosphingobium sp.]|nr:hypothetical protein [Novosphingobium sp.]